MGMAWSGSAGADSSNQPKRSGAAARGHPLSPPLGGRERAARSECREETTRERPVDRFERDERSVLQPLVPAPNTRSLCLRIPTDADH